ncbi:hypothetical protein SDC9_12901 [bioreactor metagenome]|uniref:BapA prefix-like domain-containing protein n=1 Tax=bioreactor metagenome TaxID=1076179 RepID=A0A644TJX9_9ZZZZ
MAVEIFSATSSTGGTVRAYGSEISITAPSDVYFGKGAPGIAYYEKAGTDLRVTLLDGQQVLLHDFFVIGPEGNASRLLDGAGGPVEVTGLLAPEPFQPETGVIHPAEPDQVDTAHAETGAAGAAPAAPEAEAAGAVHGEAVTEAASASDGAGGWTLFGVGLDKLAFATALGAILGEIIVSDGGNDHSSHADAAPAAGETAADGLEPASLTEATKADDTSVSEVSAAESAAAPASLVANLIGGESLTIDIASLLSADTGEAAAAASSQTPAADSSLAGGMFDSTTETPGPEADTTTPLSESDTTLADLMQGNDDVHGA